MYSHAIFTPGYDGWLDAIDRDIALLKPDSMKGYTIGDNTNKNLSKHPWRLDDEKLVYPAYEKFLKAGIRNVCVHKGLFPESVAQQFPDLLPFCRRARRGQGGEGLAAAELHRSITAGIAMPAAARPRTPGRSSNARAASTGSPTWPRSRRNTA